MGLAAAPGKHWGDVDDQRLSATIPLRGMKTPYVRHLFGADARAKVKGRFGWLTVGVASSIAWPEDDVWVEYGSFEYVLHGARQEGEFRIAPCISTPSDKEHVDEALSRLYRLTSVLGFYKRTTLTSQGETGAPT